MKLETIHEDERGKIMLLTGDLKEQQEITLFITNKGYARGGCIHNINDEYCVVLEGSIKYYIGDEYPKIYNKGMTAFIPKATPHYFVAQKDCLVAEWGATPIEKKEKHLKFREIVDKINKEIEK